MGLGHIRKTGDVGTVILPFGGATFVLDAGDADFGLAPGDPDFKHPGGIYFLDLKVGDVIFSREALLGAESTCNLVAALDQWAAGEHARMKEAE